MQAKARMRRAAEDKYPVLKTCDFDGGWGVYVCVSCSLRLCAWGGGG